MVGITQNKQEDLILFSMWSLQKKKKKKEKKSLGATKNSLGRVPKKIKIC